VKLKRPAAEDGVAESLAISDAAHGSIALNGNEPVVPALSTTEESIADCVVPSSNEIQDDASSSNGLLPAFDDASLAAPCASAAAASASSTAMNDSSSVDCESLVTDDGASCSSAAVV